MRFTVATISFNQVAFIEEALQSVLGQNWCDLEYVVMDGGSTDGSVDVLNQYRSRLSRLQIGPDGGPAAALNMAFANATGEILGFINSDDILLPGALSAVSDAFVDNPGVDFISGHCLLIDGAGRKLRKTYSDHYDLSAHAHEGCILLQPATFFRRDLFLRSNGFNESNKSCWDMELFFDFGRMGARHMILERFLAACRIHRASITGSNRLARELRSDLDRILTRHLGRNLTARDQVNRSLHKFARKVKNYRDTYQRVIGGPISGRYSNIGQ